MATEHSIPRAHSNDWYDQLATVQEGYYYPWHSTISERNGEQAFIDLVIEKLTPSSTVLEVGCGHGELALQLAPHCQHIIAYDRVEPYIELARATAAAAGVQNTTFSTWDAMAPDLPELTLPADDASIDMIICRRGPLHWIEDARRVCRPGALLIALSPMEEPIPAWTSKLPHKMHYENSGRHTGTGSIHHSVENRLHQAGLTLHSGWSFDVPEVFHAPEDLFNMVTWGLPPADTPAYEDIAYRFEGIFEKFAEPDGIHLRHCRYLWLARIPE